MLAAYTVLAASAMKACALIVGPLHYGSPPSAAMVAETFP
jgi:hypothetical protein